MDFDECGRSDFHLRSLFSSQRLALTQTTCSNLQSLLSLQIARKGGTCTQQGRFADMKPLDDDGTGVNEGTSSIWTPPHSVAPGAMWTCCSMAQSWSTLAQRVGDDVATNAAIGLDDGARHDLHALGQGRAAGNPGGWVNQCGTGEACTAHNSRRIWLPTNWPIPLTRRTRTESMSLSASSPPSTGRQVRIP